MKTRKKFRTILAMLLVLTMSASPLVSYAAPAAVQTATQAADPQLARLGTAVNNKDIGTVLDFFMDKCRSYYLTHGLEKDFPYLNAREYLKKYPDLTAAFGDDEKKALEHYVTFGYKEGRSSCAAYDIPEYLKKNPEAVLNAELLKDAALPEAYFTKLADMAKNAKNQTAAGPGAGRGSGNWSGSGGAYYFYPVTYTETDTGYDSESGNDSDYGCGDGSDWGTTTVMFYIEGSNLEAEDAMMTDSLMDAFLGIQGASGDNVVKIVMALGGSKNWHSEYLNGLLGDYKTALFAVNNSELEKAISRFSAAHDGMSIEQIYTAAHKDDDDGKAFKKELIDALFTETVLPKVQDINKKMDDEEVIDSLFEQTLNNYSASNYVLLFNGHGGGARSTIDGLSVPDLGAALKKAEFGTNESKISFIGMDACLMAGVEVADYLSAYCDYLYAHEKTSNGDAEYYSLLKTISEKTNTDDFSEAVAYRMFVNRMKYDYELQICAVFASEKCAAAEKAIDKVAVNLLALQDLSDTGEIGKIESIYKMIKRAGARTYQVTGSKTKSDGSGYLDSIEFFTALKKELNDAGVSTIDEYFDAAVKALDEITPYDGFTYYGTELYRNENGQTVSALSEFWQNYIGTTLCGSSLMVPDCNYTYLYYGNYFNKDNTFNEAAYNEAVEAKVLDYKKEYKTTYYFTGLDTYCTLMENYIRYCLGREEQARIYYLSWELLTGKALGSDTVAQDTPVAGYDSLFTVGWQEGQTDKTLEVRAVQYTEDSPQKSEYSSGDAFLDLMDTSESMKIYITRKVAATFSNGTNEPVDVSLDVIIGDHVVEYSSVSGAQEAIRILTSDLIKSRIYYPVCEREATGAEQQTETKTVKNYKDCLYLTDIETDIYRKSDVLLSFDTAYQALEGEEKEEYRKNFIAAEEYDKYMLFEGSCSYYADETKQSVYYNYDAILLFEKTADYTWTYSKCVKTEGSVYSEQADVCDVSFNHYIMAAYMDGTDRAAAIEKLTHETEGKTYYNYYNTVYLGEDGTAAADFRYSVDGKKLEITYDLLKYMDSDASHNGYEFQFTDINGKEIGLNKDNEAVEGSGYAGLLDNDAVEQNLNPEQGSTSEEEEPDKTAEAADPAEEAAEAEAETSQEAAETAEEPAAEALPEAA